MPDTWGGCTRCFSLNHNYFNFFRLLDALPALNWGTNSNSVKTKRQPSYVWRPKSTHPSEQPTLEYEEPAIYCAPPNLPNCAIKPQLWLRTTLCRSSSRHHPCSPPHCSPPPPEGVSVEADMANFAIDPTPYIPDGWKRRIGQG